MLDASYEVGLSGPGRLHDLFVTHEAMSPGEWKSGGEGLTMHYGFHPAPFGTALVMATDRGLSGLAFADPGEERAALADMQRRWPKANYVEDTARTAPSARRIFDKKLWRPDRPLRVVLIGTDFEVRVWETLLKIPMGRATTYSDIASKVGRPKAARAVGAAVGKNPISFVVPCHRVVGKIRRAHRLPLGHHPQARHARLGSRKGGLAHSFVAIAPRSGLLTVGYTIAQNDTSTQKRRPGDAGHPGRLGLARGSGRQRRPPGRTPTFDRLWATCPHAFLRTAGRDVGLPPGQMGNSEVGHLNIGAGRVVMQDLPRIGEAIATGEIKTAPALTGLIDA